MFIGDDLSNAYIIKSETTLKEFGAFADISKVTAIFEYGAQNARLRLGYKNAQTMKVSIKRVC